VLDRQQLEEFFEVGFVLVPAVFAAAEVARMRRAFDRLRRTALRLGVTADHRGSRFVLAPDPAGRPRIERIVWCGAASPTLSRYGQDPRLVSFAAQLLGSREMNQLINQAHFKLPGDGLEFAWHQDSTHRRFGGGYWSDLNGRGSYVQTVIAIDDMDEDNGPLEFLPGSCRLGHVGLPEGELPLDRVDPARALKARIEAGGVVLFGPYTYHRSSPNVSTRPRRAFINGFAYPGANSRIYPGRGAGRLVRA
jgi:ectoine hydroxylase-related dioxygenase (phytanoyl-CoA dioxygenase family)